MRLCRLGRIDRSVACLVGLAVGVFCAPASQSASESAEASITASLEGWFTAIARSAPGSDSLGARAETPGPGEPLEFSLVGSSRLPAEELQVWVKSLRTPHSRVEYRLAGLTIAKVDPAVYRVRFALQRRAIDESGLTHVAQSDQTWRIRVASGMLPVVTEIAMEPRLAFPGTGPQIVCY